MDIAPYSTEVTYHPYSVVYTITGTESEVEQTIAEINANYPPAGYGTLVLSKSVHRDGTTIAVVRRQRSCD